MKRIRKESAWLYGSIEPQKDSSLQLYAALQLYRATEGILSTALRLYRATEGVLFTALRLHRATEGIFFTALRLHRTTEGILSTALRLHERVVVHRQHVTPIGFPQLVVRCAKRQQTQGELRTLKASVELCMLRYQCESVLP